MPRAKDIFCQKFPALRLLLPFVSGILLQWYASPGIYIVVTTMIIAFAALLMVSHISMPSHFQHKLLPGIAMNILFISSGAVTLWCKDITNDRKWIGNIYQTPGLVIATADEPPVEKTNVYSVTASVNFISIGKKTYPADGKIILTFSKTVKPPAYGDRLLISKQLQPVRNSGNPGSFDYKTYCRFHGITHEAWLSNNDFIVLPGNKRDVFFEKLYQCRNYIVSVLKKYVSGPQKQGLAEALLIGYKDDLDKELVKAYANTGVVHIIAISGLHLALIYGLLMLLTTPLRGKKLVWPRFLVVVAGLWIFSLLAGAQPSILRASVMFTAIAFKMLVDRRGSVFNTISLAAFMLLCYNPFWLWDAGFQLSFLAVLSIIMFYRPIYNWLYFENKPIDFFWQLAAASIAAQVLTIPITLYYFHQFPFLFLLTNIVAVPLSSLIIYVEIALCMFSFYHPLAIITGKFIGCLIGFMNNYIERFYDLPFGLWNGISISVVQALLLYGLITGFCYWLMNIKKSSLYFSAACLLAFITLRSLSFIEAKYQQKIIVYNIPKHKAIDIISGRNCIFLGDASMNDNKGNNNTTIQSCRTAARISNMAFSSKPVFTYHDKLIVVIDSGSILPKLSNETIQLLIISGNVKFKLHDFTAGNPITNVILSPAVPAWKARQLKDECAQLQINCYSVVEKGAFVMNLQ
jgi:competence protein ComEC